MYSTQGEDPDSQLGTVLYFVCIFADFISRPLTLWYTALFLASASCTYPQWVQMTVHTNKGERNLSPSLTTHPAAHRSEPLDVHTKTRLSPHLTFTLRLSCRYVPSVLGTADGLLVFAAIRATSLAYFFLYICIPKEEFLRSDACIIAFQVLQILCKKGNIVVGQSQNLC